MNMNIRKSQSGFTLIELVIVIVILGILAAVALPRYLDLTDEATAAACDGARGAVLSQAAINIADPAINGIGGLGLASNAANIIVDGTTASDDTAGTVTVTLEGAGECPAIDLLSLGLVAVAP